MSGAASNMSGERRRWYRSTGSSAREACFTGAWTAAPRSGTRSTGRRSAGEAGRSTTEFSTNPGKARRCRKPWAYTGGYPRSRGRDIEKGSHACGGCVSPDGRCGPGTGGGAAENLPREEDLRGYFGGQEELLRGAHRFGRGKPLEDPR